MKSITIEDGDVEVTVEPAQSSEQIILGTTDGGMNWLNPHEAAELSRMLTDIAQEVCKHSRTDSGYDSDGPFTSCLDCGKQVV